MLTSVFIVSLFAQFFCWVMLYHGEKPSAVTTIVFWLSLFGVVYSVVNFLGFN